MKIKSIELVKINRPARANSALSRRKSWQARDEVANPMSRFQRFKRHRDLYSPRHWPEFGVKVTAEDATWGLGTVAGLPEGQHLTWAMPNTPWAEFFVGTDPGSSPGRFDSYGSPGAPRRLYRVSALRSGIWSWDRSGMAGAPGGLTPFFHHPFQLPSAWRYWRYCMVSWGMAAMSASFTAIPRPGWSLTSM